MVHKTSMVPWALAEPSGSSVVLEEQLNLLPILDLRQEMPTPRVSKSFLSTSQASPIPSDLGTQNPISAESESEKPAQMPFDLCSRTPAPVPSSPPRACALVSSLSSFPQTTLAS